MYIFGSEGLGEGYAYGGSTAASAVPKKQRVALVNDFISKVTILPLILLHLTYLGIVWLEWDPISIQAVCFAIFALIWNATTTLSASFLSSDVDIAEKRRQV